jgi:hyperosmotically inducible periplasmic protein
MKCTLCCVLLLAAVACEKSDAHDSKSTTDTSGSAKVAADNTGKNERDQRVAALTPGDQGGSEADRTVTQHVRQGVVDDGTLSMTAKNVKIITVDGVVTLRGPVNSAAEKSQVASIAQRVAGVTRVDDKLEIVSN